MWHKKAGNRDVLMRIIIIRPTNYNLQRCEFLKFWKILEITLTVEFLFPEAGTKWFWGRPNDNPRISFLTFLKQLLFKKIPVHAEILRNKKMSLNIKMSVNIKNSEYKNVCGYKNVSEYKNDSEYKNFSEFKYWILHHLNNHITNDIRCSFQFVVTKIYGI